MSILQETLFATSPTQTLTGVSVPSGTTAIAICTSHEQTNASYVPSACSLGGVAATKRGGANYSSGFPFGEVWYITADIGSIGTSPVLSFTPHASGNNYYSGVIFFLDNVDTTPANWVEFSDSDTNANELSVSAASPVDSIIVGVMTDTVGGNSFTCNAPLTEVTGSDRNFNGTVSRTVAFKHTATTNPTTVAGRNANTSASSYQVLYGVAIPVASTGPTITGITTCRYTGSATVTGSNFPTSQSGSAGMTIGGVAQNVTWDTSSQFTITNIQRGTLLYGVNVNAYVTNAAGTSSAAYVVQMLPKTGWSYVNLSAPLAELGKRLRTSPDLDGTEQIEYGDYQGTGTGTVYTDATFRMQAGVTGFYYAANDGVSGYADAVLQMVGGAGGGAGLLILQTAIRNATRDCYRDIVRG